MLKLNNRSFFNASRSEYNNVIDLVAESALRNFNYEPEVDMIGNSELTDRPSPEIEIILTGKGPSL